VRDVIFNVAIAGLLDKKRGRMSIVSVSSPVSIEKLVDQVCEKSAAIRSRRPNENPSREEQVLRYLCEHRSASTSEDELRAALFPAATSNAARVAIHSLRQHLEDYFRYDFGRSSPMRLEISTPYQLRLVPNDLQLDADEKFWDAHARDDDIKKLIVFTQPLFFWDEKSRSYVRYLCINFDRRLNVRGLAELREQIRRIQGARHPALRQVPCFHYQSCGESRAIGSLRRWFLKKNIEITAEVSWESSSNVYDCNSIILGNSRTNRYISEFQSPLDFLIDDDKIVNRGKLRKGEQRTYKDSPRTGAPAVAGQFAYAIVSRMSPATGRFVTLIAANNGAATQQAAELVTNKRRLQELFDRWKLRRDDAMPESFQILLRTPLVNSDTPAGETQVVTWRPRE
jgi:hypothetical protein